MKTYTCNYPIVASDMDITYRMTPNAILLYFQDCFARYLTSKHLAAFDVIKDNLIWIISEIDMNYVDERPLWSDNIQVTFDFVEIGAVRIYINYQILNSQGKPFVEGSCCWAVLNSVTKRPFSAKELLESRGISVNEEVARYEVRKPVSAEKELFQKVEHQVNVTDLDFNGHVCNRSYVTIAMGTAPIDFVRTHAPKRMHIKFLRESFFGETLKCKVFKAVEGSPVFWHSVVNSQGKEICSIYSEWTSDEAEQKDVAEVINRAHL